MEVSRCKRFDGKVVLITAATAGIGLGIAQRLGEEGGKLVICSRRQVLMFKISVLVLTTVVLIGRTSVQVRVSTTPFMVNGNWFWYVTHQSLCCGLLFTALCLGALSVRVRHMSVAKFHAVAQANVDEALRDLHSRGVEAVGCAAHVGSLPDLQRLAHLARDTYGRVDVLVSNAAVNPAAGLILDMPDSAIDKILDINIKAAIVLTREVRPMMPEVRLLQQFLQRKRHKVKRVNTWGQCVSSLASGHGGARASSL